MRKTFNTCPPRPYRDAEMRRAPSELVPRPDSRSSATVAVSLDAGGESVTKALRVA